MTCPGCGGWAPPDPETGYDADDICWLCGNRTDLAETLEEEMRMENQHDAILEDEVNEIVDEVVARVDGFGSEFHTLDVAEIYLSVGDSLRKAGNALRKLHQEKNADPQLTKKR